ncbi:glycosyltransferase [Ktedonosporobacter rubrisoli]|uniref:Glycosyltransferase n=1 Tax=Ktedonosporobacter rubrisoli TaxID=2509675 RepID=A0A4P6JQS6_KTERU|nr:glycosyltransferase [Ktedonosporobacter rubrisoli]QBD77695.1 glycosyltransferase [Ktedonosporobacter rubrisoli]
MIQQPFSINTSTNKLHISDVHVLPASSLPSAAYAGIQIKDNHLHIAMLSHDAISEYVLEIATHDPAMMVLDWLKQKSQSQHLQFVAVALPKNVQLEGLVSQLWLQEDVVPYIPAKGDTGLAPSAVDLVQAVAAHFDENNIVYPHLDEKHEVQVAELVALQDYQKTAPEQDFSLLTGIAEKLRGKKLVFINATPRGGGVALMRHALIRLLRLLQVDAHWYVLLPKKEAFDITKTKFHNVLQAVAHPETVLSTEDKALYEAWIRENATAMEPVFKQADVVVIDDPQPAGLIPFIKQINPRAKIIYRSHIQIVGKLASQPGTAQYTTWQFLWEKIRAADYFVSHPMTMFIPEDVPAEKIFFMPATTDPLDGLNKELTAGQMAIYMQHFQALLRAEGQMPLDETRPYIIQIARFDPSKGIPDVLEAYRTLRERLLQQQKTIPQLIITGNSSIDDPDGAPVYAAVREMLRAEPFAQFAEDVKVVRLPHCDQILNTLLRNSKIALQLSIKEGFEVKVTEALMKGKPVIAYKVGGIPLQIEDGVTGYLVEVGNTAQVAEHLYELLTDEQQYQQMSAAAAERANKDYLTVANAICWLYLAHQLLTDEPLDGQYQWVKALASTLLQTELLAHAQKKRIIAA